jgi:hypothetical protein
MATHGKSSGIPEVEVCDARLEEEFRVEDASGFDFASGNWIDSGGESWRALRKGVYLLKRIDGGRFSRQNRIGKS